jgi:uncharacterized protein (TIGR00369 family)
VTSSVDPSELAAFAVAPALPGDPRPGTRDLADSSLGVLDIELLHCSADEVVARMPIVAGPGAAGTLLVLAETVASTAAGLAAGEGRRAFGAELNANWLRRPSGGIAIASATPLALTRERHVWRIVVVDDSGEQLLESRCTLGVVDAPAG